MPQFDFFTIYIQGFSVSLSLFISYRLFKLYFLPSMYIFFRAKDLVQKQQTADKAIIIETFFKVAARFGKSNKEIIKITKNLLEIHQSLLLKIEAKQKYWLLDFLLNQEKLSINLIELQKNIDEFFLKNQAKKLSMYDLMETYNKEKGIFSNKDNRDIYLTPNFQIEDVLVLNFLKSKKRLK